MWVEFEFLPGGQPVSRRPPSLGFSNSQSLDVAVVSVWRRVESRYAQTCAAPRPGAIRIGGTAYSFAWHCISVACLAISKVMESRANLLQICHPR